jgi:hypothetical protein
MGVATIAVLWFGAVGLTIVAGVILVIKGARMSRAAREYEFDHRTEGGSVEFVDFEESTQHAMRKRRGPLYGGCGVVLIIFGAPAVFLIIGSMLWSQPVTNPFGP